MKRSIIKSVLVCMLVAAASVSAAAQTFMFKGIPGEKPKIRLRYLRPYSDWYYEMSALSGIYDLSLNVPINKKWSIDFSITNTRYSFGDDGDWSSYYGSLYAGMQYLSKSGDRNTIVSFGAFLLSNEGNWRYRVFAYSTNREDIFKYMHEVWTLYGNYAFINIASGGLRLGLEVGPDLVINLDNYVDTGFFPDLEFYIHYGLTAGYQGERFAVITEFVGLAWLSEDADRFVNSIDFGVSYISRQFMPGVFYKIYLWDDFRDVIDGVLGVNLEFTL